MSSPYTATPRPSPWPTTRRLVSSRLVSHRADPTTTQATLEFEVELIGWEDGGGDIEQQSRAEHLARVKEEEDLHTALAMSLSDPSNSTTSGTGSRNAGGSGSGSGAKSKARSKR